MGVRVILTTGGTGGHIFPALAVAEQLRREGAELLFVGSQYGSEAKLAKQAGLEFRGLPVRGVLGRGLRSVGALWGLFRAVFMSRAIVKDFRPDAVIGFGAYASFPSLVAAKLSGVPIAVHEQNAMPGLTNRMLAKLAKRVFLSLPDVTGAFDAKKSQLTGNPVREAIVESGKNAVGHPGTRRLLVMGGSQGAKAVNSVILASLERLTKAGIEIRHQTGSFDLERVLAGYRAHGVDASGVTPFIEDVAAAYQWADLVLCRAGATSVAELAVAGHVHDGELLVVLPADLIGQAALGVGARTAGLDPDVSPLDALEEDLLAGGAGGVDGDGVLVAVVLAPREGATGLAGDGRSLSLQDLRAHLGHEAAGEGAGDVRAGHEDLDALENAKGRILVKLLSQFVVDFFHVR